MTNVYGHISLPQTLEAMAARFGGLSPPFPNILDCSIGDHRALRPVYQVQTANKHYPVYLDAMSTETLVAYIDPKVENKAELAEEAALYLAGIAMFYIETVAKKLGLESADELPEPCHIPVTVVNRYGDDEQFSFEVQFDPHAPEGEKKYKISKPD